MSKYITRRQKKEWVEALRSDKFKQGYGKLYDYPNGTYCVFGVLDNLGSLGKQIPLPIDCSLVYLNDYARWSFPGLADFIEENVPTTRRGRKKLRLSQRVDIYGQVKGCP